MTSRLINHCGKQKSSYFLDQKEIGSNPDNEDLHILCQKQLGLPLDSFYVTFDGHIVPRNAVVLPDHIYNVVPRLFGGKGGFGSMLRAIGAQIEKTTSREACRDLSGRRMRDVNNEKQLREWVGKQADRENERESRRQERLERRRAMPNHKFDDPQYDEQKSQVSEQLEDALQTGLTRASEAGPSHTVTATATKRRAECEATTSKRPKNTEWLGIDMDNLSSSDSDSDSDSASDVHPSTSRQTNGAEYSKINGSEQDDSNDSSMVSSSNQTPDVSKDVTVEGMKSEDISKESHKSLLDLLPPPSNVSEKHSVTDIESSPATHDPHTFELENIENIEELMKFGLEKLKHELAARGLKCGGSLEQRAERLLSVKGLTQEQYPRGLLAKPAKGKKK